MEKNTGFPKLAAPALRALASAKITTVQQLTAYTEAEIAALHGIGNNALLTIKKSMAANKLAFRKK